MADYRKRSTKRRRRNEANLVGDLFRVLFAMSMLIVAIMAAFFVLQHVSGFSLPELRQTLASTEEAETPQVLTMAAETKAKETASTTAASTTETESESETETEAESSKEESTAESTKEEKETKESAKESASISDEGPTKQTEAKSTAADRDYEERDYTTEEKPIRGGAVVGEAPTAGNDSSAISGPGADVQVGQGPVQ